MSWKQFERDVANYLTARVGHEVKTGRNSAAAGRQSDSDLWWTDEDGRQWPGVLGLTVECKNVAQRQVPTWLRQAAEACEADHNDWYAVVWKDSTARTSLRDCLVFIPTTMLRDYLEFGLPSPGGYSAHDYTFLSLAAFVEVWW